MPPPSDTSPAAERILVEGFRRMTPADKMKRVASMNRAVEQFALARLRAQYGEMSETEQRLRLAALRLDPGIMRTVFGWDPDVRGL
jgi:hypothetical protein